MSINKNIDFQSSDFRPRTSDLGSWAAPRAGAGLFLHASAVEMDGGALLFLGHSTAGKSTLARLLGQTVPVLADDSVFAARGADGDWRVVDGSFRFGRDDLSTWQETVQKRVEGEGSVRLRGCLRIHKADALKIEPLHSLELARYLMDAAMEIDLQRKFGRSVPKGKTLPERTDVESIRRVRRQWFGQVAEIARGCPGWNLWFSMDSDSSDLCNALQNLKSTKNIKK